MTLTDLRKNGLYPTTAKALAVRDYHSYDCPFGDFLDCFYFSDCWNERLCQCGVIRTSIGYSVVCYNCALIQESYPVDCWQIDKKYGTTERVFAVHHFHNVVLKILKKSMHLSEKELLNV